MGCLGRPIQLARQVASLGMPTGIVSLLPSNGMLCCDFSECIKAWPPPAVPQNRTVQRKPQNCPNPACSGAAWVAQHAALRRESTALWPDVHGMYTDVVALAEPTLLLHLCLLQQ